MKFKSFRGKKGESMDPVSAEMDHAGSSSEILESDVPRERKMPAKEEQAPPPEQAKEPEAPPPEEYKFGIADRLQRAVAEHSFAGFGGADTKRSPDLVPLTKQFEETRKRLRQLIATSKRYHASISTLDQDRMKMAQELAKFAENSPIAGQVTDMDNSNDKQVSYLSVYHQVSQQVNKYSDKYERDIIDYCTEWEAVISKRVDAEVAAVKKLRESYNHYQVKVEGMRKKFNGQESKGKTVKDDMKEKLQRNETKLEEASSDYEAAAAPLCCLMEEVVEQVWKDLAPVLQSTMSWEADRSHKEAKLFQQLRSLEVDADAGNKAKSSSSSSSKSSSSPPKKKSASGSSSSKKIAQFNPEQLKSVQTEGGEAE